MIKYNLLQKIPVSRYYEIILIGDANDGDYVTSTEKYTQKEFDSVLLELFDLMKILGKDYELEKFASTGLYLPCSENGTCHSLEEVKVTMYDVDGYVYDVVIMEE